MSELVELFMILGVALLVGVVVHRFRQAGDSGCTGCASCPVAQHCAKADSSPESPADIPKE